MRPQTRHVNQKYHHFREWVKSGLIDILPIDTEEQPADLMTKPLDLALFMSAEILDERMNRQSRLLPRDHYLK
jgi:hypothetical protein